MTQTDTQQFAAIMGTLGLTYGVEMTAKRIKIYFDSLSDFGIESIGHAAKEIIKHEMRFPVPAMIRDYALRFRKPQVADLSRPALEYTPPELAQEKIEELLKQMDSWGLV